MPEPAECASMGWIGSLAEEPELGGAQRFHLHHWDRRERAPGPGALLGGERGRLVDDDAHRVTAEPLPVDVNDLAQQVVRLLLPKVRAPVFGVPGQSLAAQREPLTLTGEGLGQA